MVMVSEVQKCKSPLYNFQMVANQRIIVEIQRFINLIFIPFKHVQSRAAAGFLNPGGLAVTWWA